MPIKALLFDLNGVIADDEPVHLRLFQRVLKEEGIPFTKSQYYKKYLAMDDRGCFKGVFREHGRSLGAAALRRLIRRKFSLYAQASARGIRIFPGAVNLVREARKHFSLAIASGALRWEIKTILRQAGIERAFSVIVCAEDVSRGKPSPETYRLAFSRLRRRIPELRPGECAVIEDSFHGIRSAQAAGMKCLAVCHSYPRGKLRGADWVVPRISQVRISELIRRLETNHA